ncbi:D-alanyl-D-alanine carboxypeptidase PBP3 [Streptococcus oriscaviae]|uniref:serine-type D-Ala-D-Ala carboxypeptidase n=1 Tax=Streptococcus oriscaviae TaxID=2781599 RepID=A0ABX7YN88_9STRE|nr:D-alanyl-D-alanine carboxypeptidase PBP3 [Streptococcus oriscaviae]QUE55297.1 D-alanyl-D-alanine carboxypeptidase PBP3 [Streptococcus oriscaviae]
MRKYIALLVGLALSLFLGGPKLAAEDFSVAAKHAIAVEVSTGKILYEQDSQTQAGVASITKLLTVYLVYEAIEKGELQLTTPVDISDYPFSLTSNPLLTNVILDSRNYTVEELLHASLISSSNSAAIALAEKIAGSETAFVDRMREKLKEWGITEAKIYNVSGLDNEDSGEHIYPGSKTEDFNTLSALDVAIITRKLILDFPQVLDITSKLAFDLEGETYYNTNQMLEGGTHARGGVDGLKTGFSDATGASFVATTTQNDMRIITVVIQATDGNIDPDNRFVATNNLINYVYENFSAVPLVEKGKQYKKSSVAVFNGQTSKAPAVAAEQLLVIQRKNSDKEITARFEAATDELDAPLTAGTAAGTLYVSDTDLIGKGYLEKQPSVEMVIGKDVKEASWPTSWWNQFVRYVNENL